MKFFDDGGEDDPGPLALDRSGALTQLSNVAHSLFFGVEGPDPEQPHIPSSLPNLEEILFHHPHAAVLDTRLKVDLEGLLPPELRCEVAEPTSGFNPVRLTRA